MSDLTFSKASIQEAPQDIPVDDSPKPEVKKDRSGEMPASDLEPITKENSAETILNLMGIDDNPEFLSESDMSNLKDVADLIESMVKQKGLQEIKASYEKVLEKFMEDLEIDKLSEPSKALEKMAKCIDAWKSLAFLRDPKERRSIFMRLGKLSDAKEIDSSLMQIMESRKVWQ